MSNIITILCVVGTMIGGLWLGFDIGYKVGQVHAINGRIHYHLSTNEIGSLEWKKTGKSRYGL